MTQISVLDSRYSWLRLCVTLLIAVVANAGMWVVITVMPAVEAEFELNRAAASMPYTLTMVGFALGNFGLGQAIDRFGVVRSLIGATIAIVAGFTLAIYAPSVTVLSLAQLLIGLGAAVGFGPLIADISHWFMRRRGIAVALVASGNYLSGAIWSVALSDLLQSDGWRAVYAFLAILTACFVIPMALLLRRKITVEAQQTAQAMSDHNAQSVGLSPRALALLLGVAGLGCCLAMSMPQVHIVSYCVDLGYGPAVGAEMLSLMLLGGVVSRIISGLVADRLGGVMTLLLGSSAQCVALFLYLPSDALVSLYVVSTIFGLSQGGIVPSYALIVREYMPARAAGAWVGFVLMTTIIGMALGGWVSAWIYDVTGSYDLAFWNGIAWNGLNIAVMLWLLSRAKPRVTAQAA